MNAKIWLINIALLGMVAVFGFRAYAVWSNGTVLPAQNTVPKSDRKQGAVTVSLIRKKLPPRQSFDLLVEKNLFSPERQYIDEEPTEEKAAVKPGTRMSKQIFLYGVVFAKDSRKALVSDPDRRRRGRKEVWVKVGDSLGDFHVTRIEREMVVLKKDGKLFDISLYDKAKQRRQVPVRRVVKPKVTTPKPKPPKTTPTRTKPKTPKSRIVKKGNRTVVKTPFGTIKRRKE